MTGWLVAACVVAYATKCAGFLVPARLLERPAVRAVSGSTTVGLLAALTVMNALASGTDLRLDARVVALVVAGIACWRRVPFLLVVVLGAVSVAVARQWGMA